MTMTITTTTSTEISDADLRKAIELRISGCFPALNLANSLAGAQSVPWQVLRTFNFDEIISEAHARGAARIPLADLRGAVDGRSIFDAPVYQKVLEVLSGLDLPRPKPAAQAEADDVADDEEEYFDPLRPFVGED